MKKWRVILAIGAVVLPLAVVAAPVAVQDYTNFWKFITQSATATGPFSTTDWVPLIRGNQTFRTAATDLISPAPSGALPEKVSGTNGACGADDTAALAAAIAAAYANGPPQHDVSTGGMTEFYLGNGCYRIGGSGAEVLLFQHPIHFWGPATFQIANTTGANTDIFHIRPAAIADNTPWVFEGFSIQPQPLSDGHSGIGSAGRDVFSLDVSGSAALQLEQITIRDINEIVAQNGVTGGAFIRARTAVGQTSGQIFRGIYANNHIYHCIDLSANVSDSQRIIQNTIIAPTPGDTNCGFNLKMISGAGNGVIQRNNISVNGGNIISGGVNTDISANEFEQDFTSNQANGTMIDVNVTDQPLDSTWIHNNQFQSVVAKTTVQLTSITGIANSQSVTGAGVPGGCSVERVSTPPQKWVLLSCYQTSPIIGGATLTIGGVGFTVAQTAGQGSGTNIGDATAVRNTAVGTVIGPNRYGSQMGSPLIINVAPGATCLLPPGNTFTVPDVPISDSGGGCINLITFGLLSTYTPTLSCETGTLTSGTAVGYYTRMASQMYLQISIDIVTAGTCSGSLYASLPTGISGSSVVNSFISGRNIVNSKMISGLLTNGLPDVVGMLYYDGNPIPVDGAGPEISGWVTTAPP